MVHPSRARTPVGRPPRAYGARSWRYRKSRRKMTNAHGLAIIETHPVQYHAPVYRAVQRLGVPITVVYGSDFSVAGYRDREFGARFAWDTDLLSGYSARFLTQVATGGAADY